MGDPSAINTGFNRKAGHGETYVGRWDAKRSERDALVSVSQGDYEFRGFFG